MRCWFWFHFQPAAHVGMDSSSESDAYDRPRGHRSRLRESRMTHDSRFPRDTNVSDISDKIETLANTLQVNCTHLLNADIRSVVYVWYCWGWLTACALVQDTSRNLNKVDRMLGQYREQTDDQTEAMATVSIAVHMGLSLISDKGIVLRAWLVY